MIGYITLGSSNVPRSIAFYDAVLIPLGARRTHTIDQLAAWAFPEGPSLSLTRPFDGQAATVGNGVMVALKADSQGAVDAVHALAMAHGGTDEGAPGLRGGTFYGAYFRDPDGNKLNVHHMG